MKRKKGFTLIELIAVICIIAILASVIAPKVTRYVKRANDTKYFVDAKTISQAIDMYNSENLLDEISKNSSLTDIKAKLTDEDKKYIESWPGEIKIKSGNEYKVIKSSEIGSYTYENLIEFIEDEEEKKIE